MWAEGPGATTEGASLGLLPGRLKRGRVTGATLLHASRTPPLQGLVAMAPSPKAPRMSQFVVATCIALRRTGLSLRKIATHRLVKKRDGKHPAQQSVDKCGRQERRVWKRTQMGATSRLRDVIIGVRRHRRRVGSAAKEKILGEEPHHEYACMPLCVPHRPLASEDMGRGGGGQSARVFAIGVILDPKRVIVFLPSLHTVLRKVPKMGWQKGAKRAGPERPERPELFLLEVSF